MEPGVWQSAFASAAAEFLGRLLAYLPNIAAALGLALAGWIAAWLASAVVVRLVGGTLVLLGRQASLGRAVERSRLGPGFARLLGRVVFWFVAALFLAAAVERLELTIAASLVSALAAFLPRVLAGLVIVFGGIVGGQVAFSAINRAAGAAGLPQATLLARSAQMILVFLGVVTGADQVGIQSTLLTAVVATTVAAVLGGATLAFGLGSRTAVANIVAMFYVLKTYHVGQVVRIGNVEGPIVDITQTGVLIASPEGRVLVPGARFSQETSTLVAGGQA
jgi:small-conductance mechanosensitive channel